MENIYNAIQNVYNMDKTTWQEVLAELYNLVSKVENKFDLFENKFGQLLGEEVTLELKKMYDDGSLATLINDKLLKDISTKVDTFKTEVSEQMDTNVKQTDKKINELENKTATKIELEVERKRINNLTSLPEGATVGDAELIDGRIGANGFVYDNIGEAIREQVKKKLDNSEWIDLEIYQVHSDRSYYINSDNTISFTTTGSYNSKIYKVEPSDEISVTLNTNSRETDFKYVIFGGYDNDKFISKGYGIVTNTAQSFVDEKLIVPAETELLIVNFFGSTGNVKINKKIEYTRETYVNKNVTLINENLRRHDVIQTKTNALVDMDNLRYNCGLKTWITSATMNLETSYLYGNGVSEENNTRVCTYLYEVKMGQIISSAYEKASQKAFNYILFDLQGNFIKIETDVKLITIPQNGYILFDFSNDQLIPEGIVILENEDQFPYVRPYYNNNFNLVPYHEDEKPLDVIDKTGGYMAIFHDFGVIGDSLSVGNMEGVDTTDNSYIYKDNFDYSWGKSIERATGCTYHRFGRGGQYLHDDNWFNEWKDKISADLCQAYFICIGFNDYNWLSEDSSRYGSIVDIKSDYTQNPNTLYGQYGKIIQLIQSVQPKARIFLINMEWNNTDGSKINTCISDMVSHFDNCYLIDLHTYAHEPTWGVPNIFKTGVYHKNTLGYQKMAWDIMSYTDYIIRHNMNEFIDVQFIGTPYRLPTEEEVLEQS